MGLMDDYDHNPYAPPPHMDVEAHERLLKRVEQMTPEEFFQTLVRAGIYTPEGELTEHYRPESDEPATYHQGLELSRYNKSGAQ